MVELHFGRIHNWSLQTDEHIRNSNRSKRSSSKLHEIFNTHTKQMEGKVVIYFGSKIERKKCREIEVQRRDRFAVFCDYRRIMCTISNAGKMSWSQRKLLKQNGINLYFHDIPVFLHSKNGFAIGRCVENCGERKK